MILIIRSRRKINIRIDVASQNITKTKIGIVFDNSMVTITINFIDSGVILRKTASYGIIYNNVIVIFAMNSIRKRDIRVNIINSNKILSLFIITNDLIVANIGNTTSFIILRISRKRNNIVSIHNPITQRKMCISILNINNTIAKIKVGIRFNLIVVFIV